MCEQGLACLEAGSSPPSTDLLSALSSPGPALLAGVCSNSPPSPAYLFLLALGNGAGSQDLAFSEFSFEILNQWRQLTLEGTERREYLVVAEVKQAARQVCPVSHAVTGQTNVTPNSQSTAGDPSAPNRLPRPPRPAYLSTINAQRSARCR